MGRKAIAFLYEASSKALSLLFVKKRFGILNYSSLPLGGI
jgi:hypothetical protein